MAARALSSPRPALRREEAAALVVALAGHVGLVAWLALNPPAARPLPVPERMTVTFSDQVADQATAPKLADAAPAAAAPESADNPAAEPAPQPRPEPHPAPPKPAPPKPAPPKSAPPKPAPPKPAPPSPRAAAARPELARVQPVKPQPFKPQPVKLQPAKAPPAQAQAAKPAPRTAPVPARPAPPAVNPGRSRFDEAFQKAPGGPARPAPRNPGSSTAPNAAPAAPATVIGPQVKAALSGAIARQLKPKWVAPQGAEADQLITVLAWDLNPDGTLAGPPRLVSQSGVTDANRPQAQRHVEQAMRAVRLAAPFDLPPDLYAGWRHVTQFRFDRKLSQ